MAYFDDVEIDAQKERAASKEAEQYRLRKMHEFDQFCSIDTPQIIADFIAKVRDREPQLVAVRVRGIFGSRTVKKQAWLMYVTRSPGADRREDLWVDKGGCVYRGSYGSYETGAPLDAVDTKVVPHLLLDSYEPYTGFTRSSATEKVLVEMRRCLTSPPVKMG